jgi:hypothetical protein
MNNATMQPAEPKDIWLRHLLFEIEISNNGEVNPQFFENAFKKPRTEKGQPWALEISGRLLSMTIDSERQASNVETVAIQKANELQQKAEQLQQPSHHWRTARFRGIIYQTVEVIRTIEPGLYDVFYDPSKEDVAHANLVRLVALPQIKKGKVSPRALAKLMESFQVVNAGSPELRKLLQLKT